MVTVMVEARSAYGVRRFYALPTEWDRGTGEMTTPTAISALTGRTTLLPADVAPLARLGVELLCSACAFRYEDAAGMRDHDERHG